MISAAVGDPAVKLCRILELLSPQAADGEKDAGKVGQRGQIAPELLELGDREDILLAVPPAPFHILDGHVSRHPCRQGADRGGDLLGSLREIVAGQVQRLQQAVDTHPGGQCIVVPESELGFLARLSQPFQDPQPAGDP